MFNGFEMIIIKLIGVKSQKMFKRFIINIYFFKNTTRNLGKIN